MLSSSNNKHQFIWIFFLATLVWPGVLSFPACKGGGSEMAQGSATSGNPHFSLDELQYRTFQYFWQLADSSNFQIPDRYPTLTFSSVAATGFGLTAYLIGVERGYVSRAKAAERVLNTLRVLKALPQGPEPSGVAGYKGFYYHFLNLRTVTRYKKVELSTIDTGLLMAGILSTQTFFDADNPVETAIRDLADFLYRRVEWNWALNDDNRLSMGWHPEKGYISSDWQGYNEAMILLILALGSPTHTIPADTWDKWCSTYSWNETAEAPFVDFHALFGHQYSQLFIDFRSIQDPYMREKGIDYFENSRRATLANRSYCIQNPSGFIGYHEKCWGLTACDGPAAGQDQLIDSHLFKGYAARGPSITYTFDDGTIAPTAAGGSIPFAPEACIPALQFMWETYYHELVGEFGFKDAFNLTYPSASNQQGWFDHDYIGIDQGPILIQVENYRSGFVWELMKKNPYIKQGLLKAGFSGGWLQ